MENNNLHRHTREGKLDAGLRLPLKTSPNSEGHWSQTKLVHRPRTSSLSSLSLRDQDRSTDSRAAEAEFSRFYHANFVPNQTAAVFQVEPPPMYQTTPGLQVHEPIRSVHLDKSSCQQHQVSRREVRPWTKHKALSSSTREIISNTFGAGLAYIKLRNRELVNEETKCRSEKTFPAMASPADASHIDIPNFPVRNALAVPRLNQIRQHLINPSETTDDNTRPSYNYCPSFNCHVDNKTTAQKRVVLGQDRRSCIHACCDFESTTAVEWYEHDATAHTTRQTSRPLPVAMEDFAGTMTLSNDASGTGRFPPIVCDRCGRRDLVKCHNGADGPCVECVCGRHIGQASVR